MSSDDIKLYNNIISYNLIMKLIHQLSNKYHGKVPINYTHYLNNNVRILKIGIDDNFIKNEIIQFFMDNNFKDFIFEDYEQYRIEY